MKKLIGIVNIEKVKHKIGYASKYIWALIDSTFWSSILVLSPLLLNKGIIPSNLDNLLQELKSFYLQGDGTVQIASIFSSLVADIFVVFLYFQLKKQFSSVSLEIVIYLLFILGLIILYPKLEDTKLKEFFLIGCLLAIATFRYPKALKKFESF